MWHVLAKKKPKKNGWYLCTVEVPGMQRYVMDLYWYKESQKFKDNRRQSVYDDYKVYGYNDETGRDDKLLKASHLCDRTANVIAWRKLPRAYMKGFVEEDWISEH